MIREQLIQLAEEKYRKFASSLLPDSEPLLGVKLPILRKIAKQIVKEGSLSFLEQGEEFYFEEIMLKGMVIGYLNVKIEQLIQYIRWFVPKIQNWSICDSFCVGLKQTRNYKEQIKPMLLEYAASDKEFEERFGIVMLFTYYKEEQERREVLALFQKINPKGYYAKMAIAWAISTYYIIDKKQVLTFLSNDQLDSFTYQKALQKIVESNRVPKEEKEELKKQKKQLNKLLL